MANANEAIKILQQVIEATPQSNPERLKYISILGTHYNRRYLRTKSKQDLQKTIETMRQAADAQVPQDETLWSFCMSPVYVLSHRLSDRYFITGEMADLDENIRHLRRMVDMTP